MERSISGYHVDDDGDWVAELDCGHGQHVRHTPPFFQRPWVTSVEGRNSRLGHKLNCLRCDELEFPEGLIAFSRTPEFTKETIPPGLQASHTTKVGVWGRIHVLEGLLRYCIPQEPPREFLLDAEHDGIIAPELPHFVKAEGELRFYVEFFRKSA